MVTEQICLILQVVTQLTKQEKMPGLPRMPLQELDLNIVNNNQNIMNNEDAPIVIEEDDMGVHAIAIPNPPPPEVGQEEMQNMEADDEGSEEDEEVLPVVQVAAVQQAEDFSIGGTAIFYSMHLSADIFVKLSCRLTGPEETTMHVEITESGEAGVLLTHAGFDQLWNNAKAIDLMMTSSEENKTQTTLELELEEDVSLIFKSRYMESSPISIRRFTSASGRRLPTLIGTYLSKTEWNALYMSLPLLHHRLLDIGKDVKRITRQIAANQL